MVEEPVFSAQVNRLNEVVVKTTAGLYEKTFGEPLKLGSWVGAQLASRLTFDRAPLAELHYLLMQAPPKFHWEGIYTARVLSVQDAPETTVWWHVFYDRLEFIAATIPANRLEPPDEPWRK